MQGMVMNCLYEGCLSVSDTEVERRPYHRNCGCALHRSGGGTSGCSRRKEISYPMRRSWSESCLAFGLAAASGSGSSSPASLPSPSLDRTSRVEISKEELQEY
ncbi:hypothetical protein Syun_025473 [Stephania yunnanensis]|uniref:Uncharacterized protein n=1 Tax=Stephania yunnanensis TaxID=152371 RepID=A0AAP0HRA5_9MAGN